MILKMQIDQETLARLRNFLQDTENHRCAYRQKPGYDRIPDGAKPVFTLLSAKANHDHSKDPKAERLTFLVEIGTHSEAKIDDGGETELILHLLSILGVVRNEGSEKHGRSFGG